MAGTPDYTLQQTETRRTISPFDFTAANNLLLKGPNHDGWTVLTQETSSSSSQRRGQANVVLTHQSVTAPLITDKDRDGISGLSADQWEMIMKLLNVAKPASSEQLTGVGSFSWILDTGCTHHMTGTREHLFDIRNIEPVMVVLADGNERLALQAGTVRLSSQLLLKSVYLVDGLQSDLISVGQLLDENRSIIQMTDKFLLIQDRSTKMVIGVGKRQDGTFVFRGMEIAAVSTTKKEVQSVLWHKRYGHPSDRVLTAVSDISVCPLNTACDICLRAKKTRNSFPLSSNKAEENFDLIHVDIWGPYRHESSSGARFFLTIVDDRSRGVWVFLLNSKSETQSKLRQFFTMIERQFSKKIKKVRSDNGLEFIAMRTFFQDIGVLHETSCAYTPSQNGRVERKHRHILNVARSLMFQASLPIRFWGESILTAAYLINRTPSTILSGKTPFEMLYAKPPSSDHLRVFGCACYAINTRTHGDKFADRAKRYVFLGYPHGQKGWRLLDLDTETFIVSRDVTFLEDEFPFAESASSSSAPDSPVQTDMNILDFLLHKTATPMAPIIESSAVPIDTVPTVISEPSTTSDNASLDSVSATHEEQVFAPVPAVDPVPVPEIPEVPAAPAPSNLRRSTRVPQPSSRLKDFVKSTVTRQSTVAASNSLRYPLSNYISSHRLSTSHRAFQAAITVATEPQTYRDAVQHKAWREAMASEIKAQESNGTWEITTLPPNKHAIGSKWVYKFKYKSDGTLERHKARLVALGNRQLEGRDYGETFAPVAKMSTVRLFLKFAATHNWAVHQMDVHNAFLHGDLTEEVYMHLPPGFTSSKPNQVCRLRKSIYGLKQSPRCWFSKLSSALIQYGFNQSTADYSLFTLHEKGFDLRILIYVDDLIIMGSSELEVARFKRYLAENFHMKDLGFLKYFLGIEVARNKDGIFLCQRKYALDIIADTGLLGSRPTLVPLPTNHQLALSTSSFLHDPLPYRRLIGKLIYLANTRPDLAYSVHILAQFLQAPRQDHWDAALRLVRYLKNSPGQGILLSSIDDLSINGWCDSDWGSCPLTRRSLTGYIVRIGDSPISWKTKKQPTVSRSSAEAEYRSMAMLVQELIWVKRLLHDLGYSHDASMMVYSDSKSALDIARNPVFHERTKHIGIDCHFIRDEIVAGNVCAQFVTSSQQLADLLTKPLSRIDLCAHNGKLSIIDIHAPLEGG